MERVGIREDHHSWHLEQVTELFNLCIVIVTVDCGNFPSSDEHFLFQFLELVLCIIRDTDVESEAISE